jgi:hypothetical protein
MRLVVICPSRGRPDKALEAYQSFIHSKCNSDSDMIFVVDEDDETMLEYRVPFMTPPHDGGMGNALNAAAAALVEQYDYLGFVGDDHRFRTPCWDTHITKTLKKAGGGIAYGNDLMQSINLPTQVFMDSSIVEALGWMALPGAKHLYLDDTWKALGEGLDRLFYFPEIIIEHMHPASGKAEWDEGYKRVNDQSVYSHDQAVFLDWRDNDYVTDIAKARAALERHGDGGGVE